jgi:hypothetical protein
MRRYTDPLALDPLGPIGISPIADISSTTGSLALEPLAPLSTVRPQGRVNTATRLIARRRTRREVGRSTDAP